MPTLSTPILTLGAPAGNQRPVTVAGTITFEAGDVGRTYRMEIKLFGEDKACDILPTGDAAGDDLLYVYSFNGPVLPRPYRSISVTAAGTMPYSETRSLSAAVLDEDPGREIIGMADIHSPVYMPRADEVYASVTISCAAITQRSATVVASIGV